MIKLELPGVLATPIALMSSPLFITYSALSVLSTILYKAGDQKVVLAFCAHIFAASFAGMLVAYSRYVSINTPTTNNIYINYLLVAGLCLALLSFFAFTLQTGFLVYWLALVSLGWLCITIPIGAVRGAWKVPFIRNCGSLA